jgi:ubiquitin carboxyl-terminal hydrolase 7
MHFVHFFQDAKKGMLFTDFPPVLQLQLKRFEYDFTRDTMVKVWNTLCFPHHLFVGYFIIHFGG